MLRGSSGQELNLLLPDPTHREAIYNFFHFPVHRTGKPL